MNKIHLRIIIPALALFLILFGCISEMKSDETTGIDIAARSMLSDFFEEESLALHSRFSENMSKNLSLEDLEKTISAVLKSMGALYEITGYYKTDINGLKQHIFALYMTESATPINFSLWLNDRNQIEGLLLAPPSEPGQSPYSNYETKTELILPFTDEWYVYWGGRSVIENYHAAYSDQQFAYDFLIVNDGYTYSGDPKENSSYYAFGKEVLAPGDGIVLSCKNTIPDNVPGIMNPEAPLGNYVILDHGNGEFSFIAHFKQGSLTVEKGQTVKRGELIGLCGNSGNSSEAHIHYHLQNSGTFGSGEGLPAIFHNYLADGKSVKAGEPVQRQTVKNK